MIRKLLCARCGEDVSSPLQIGIIDTGIFRAWLEGSMLAIDFLSAMNRIGRPQLSQLSAMELTCFARDQAEHANLLQFLTGCNVRPLNAKTVARATRILDRLAPPTGLTASDLLIAATALIHKLPLYTIDPGRFSIVPGLNCIQPY